MSIKVKGHLNLRHTTACWCNTNLPVRLLSFTSTSARSPSYILISMPSWLSEDVVKVLVSIMGKMVLRF
jgi:hypothetical protein